MVPERSQWREAEDKDRMPADGERPSHNANSTHECGFDSCGADIWDAFELDGEVDDPQPEYGDFWPQLDDEEEP